MGQAIAPLSKSILIVEDEAFVRYDLVDFFEEAGFRVFDAGNADEAIAILEEQSEIQIVLTDVQMPGSMDGVKLSYYIRDRFPPTLLVIVSGAERLRADQIPAHSLFIPKPYDHHAMLRAILARS